LRLSLVTTFVACRLSLRLAQPLLSQYTFGLPEASFALA